MLDCRRWHNHQKLRIELDVSTQGQESVGADRQGCFLSIVARVKPKLVHALVIKPPSYSVLRRERIVAHVTDHCREILIWTFNSREMRKLPRRAFRWAEQNRLSSNKADFTDGSAEGHRL